MKNYIILKVQNLQPTNSDIKTFIDFLEDKTKIGPEVEKFKNWIDERLPLKLDEETEWKSVDSVFMQILDYPGVKLFNEEIGEEKCIRKMEFVVNDDPEYKNIRGYYQAIIDEEGEEALFLKDFKAFSVRLPDNTLVSFKDYYDEEK